MFKSAFLRISLGVLVFLYIFLFSHAANAQSGAPIIEYAPLSGVSGYTIRIFGANFGTQTSSSSVKILNTSAPITSWKNTYIEATIPQAADGKGTLQITTAGGSISQNFELYTINPAFLVKPANLTDIIINKPVYFTNVESEYFIGTSPSTVLSRHDVYYSGGKVFLKSGAIVAVNTGMALNEPVWFTFWGSSNFYPNFEALAKAYTIEGSTNSTNGVDGTWSVLLSVPDNTRLSRTHKVNPQGSTWLRLHVSNVSGGTAFPLQEIRVHKKMNASDTGPIDAIGIIGDSITAGDFGLMANTQNFMILLNKKRNNGAYILPVIAGMVGQNAVIFSSAGDPAVSLAAAMAENPDMTYWGIGIGTNDSAYEYNMQNYDSYMTQGVQRILAANKVPIIARIPDTDPSGFGSPQGKKVILTAIDTIAAKYRLIPGPDLFGVFRNNILFGNGSYLSDGTHHSYDGGVVENSMWGDALIKAGLYSGTVAATPMPSATPVRLPSPTAVPSSALSPTKIPAPSITPTPSPTQIPPTILPPTATPTISCVAKTRGDADCDGQITLSDYELIRSHFGNAGGAGDINGDSIINLSDYTIWQTEFIK